MKKNLFLFLFAFALVLNVQAEDRTERDMQRIAAAKLWAANDATAKKQAANGNREISKATENSAFAIYSAKGRGSVIVGRDKAYPEVLGYTTTEYSAETTLPCGFRWWLNAMEQNLNLHQAKAVRTPGAYATNITEVPEMLTTRWGQDAPYNNLCPAISGEHALTGCVATAMAQVLRYFRYPVQGTGIGSYTVNSSGIPRSKEITSTYDWDLMLDNYGFSNSPIGTEAQQAAVATLMFDAGAASQMDYGVNASSAYTSNAAAGFADNFGYDPLSLRMCSREYYSDEEWMQLVYGELQAGRPIMYGGVDPVYGGHAFVLDGIDSDGFVHVNWGWNGSYNGYFNIDLLDSPGGSYSEMQDMIIGFKTQSTPDADEVFRSEWGTSDYTVSVGLGPLTISMGAHYNYHYQTFKGSLGLCCKKTDGTGFVFLPAERAGTGDVTNIEVQSGYGWRNEDGSRFTYTVKTSTLPNGTYTAFFASKDERDVEPQPFRCYGGPIYYTLTKSGIGAIEISDPHDTPSSIANPQVDTHADSKMIYSIDGRNVGEKMDALQNGIYIKNGKKVMKTTSDITSN